MTAFVYILIAIVAAAMSTRAWLGDRYEPSRTAFLMLGWGLAIAWLLYAAAMIPGFGALRIGYMGAGAFIPAALMYTFDRIFSPKPIVSVLVFRLLLVSGLLVPIAIATHVLTWSTPDLRQIPLIVLGAYTFAAFGLVVMYLWQVHQSMPVRVDKVRIRYLMGITVGAVAMAAVEEIARLSTSISPTESADANLHAVALQGPIPPFSALLGVVAIYFIYQAVISYRLLDLYELLSRIGALGIAALALVALDGVAVLWVDAFQDYPLHIAFQAFVASILFLAAYDPLKSQIDWWANRLLNTRGHQLFEAIEGLRIELPKATSKEGLTQTVLRRLHDSGRVPVCSVYLWESSRDAYGLMELRGDIQGEPLAMVAGPPFIDGFVDSELRWYSRADLTRANRIPDHHDDERLRLMDAMHADLTIPFRSGGVILGWMHLRDESWSDGFSSEEISRLSAIGELAGMSLSNIQEFQALEEAQRLAALGAMAAGLAHEIRNPLAGIKGAVQYLQAEKMADDAQDMLDVAVLEVDRLNVVVSQFLEYARPFNLDRSTDHINAIVAHIVQVLNAQGLPKGVTIVQDVAPDLPPMSLDRGRLSQVLLNLSQNGIQAMTDGGILTIATRLRTSGRRQLLELSVQDQGPGIPESAKSDLFIPFFTTKEEGTGLGLAISQRIVRAHGGELEVISREGRGATFIALIPVLPTSTAEEQPQSTPSALRSSASVN